MILNILHENRCSTTIQICATIIKAHIENSLLGLALINNLVEVVM
jgi:hypothetical protein